MDYSHGKSLFRAFCCLSLFPLATVFCSQTSLCAGEGETKPPSLVQQALQAELDGDTENRIELLATAIENAPDAPTAKWLSGMIKHDDRWMSVEQSAELNASNNLVTQYCVLRDRYAGNLSGEISLARWCRINDLDDRERLHWTNVINRDSSNADARKRLKLRNFRGQLVTKDQVDAYKQSINDRERALRKWGPKLGRLRREIKASPSSQNSDAFRELAEIDDPEAVPSMEKVARTADLDFQVRLIDTIGSIGEQVSSDALVRLSLNLKEAPARRAAARNLADHPVHSYAPQYLERLESPIQYVSSLNSVGDVVVSHTRMRQERPDDALNVMQFTKAGLTVQDPRMRNTRVYRRIVAREVSLQRRKIAATQQAIEVKNAQTNRENDRIFAALRTSTGQEIDDTPKLWWDWWKQYNEYLVAENKREYYFATTSYRRSVMRLPRPPRRHECFPAGTLVHTETGTKAIELIRQGDKVLSQDSASGELLYQLVTQTTVRPPSDTMLISVAGEQITATLGHPFWVVGKGWTMAKELNPGDRLHGINGSQPIEFVEGGVNSEAHNLIVDKTNSYFVGETGFLVHDNIIRAASRVPLPGWNANQ